MNIQQAKNIARQWVIEASQKLSGFYGAFFHGSINWLPENSLLPLTSDVDIIVVLTDPEPPDKPGKFIYQDVLLEVSYLPASQFQSAEEILDQYHLAGNFRIESIISDPSGQLSELQVKVAENFSKRKWVQKRCQGAYNKVIRNVEGINKSNPLHHQVMMWLFANGVMTHVLLTAGMKNPTVRTRYLSTKELLAKYKQLDFYESLLEKLACAHLSKERVEHHLATMTEAFDIAKIVIKTPVPYASDIRDISRFITVDGSRELIDNGHHREAMFWIMVTYSRCQEVLYHDATVEIQDKYRVGFENLLDDLGIKSSADLHQRGEQIREFLPSVLEVAESIMSRNPEIIA